MSLSPRRIRCPRGQPGRQVAFPVPQRPAGHATAGELAVASPPQDGLGAHAEPHRDLARCHKPGGIGDATGGLKIVVVVFEFRQSASPR
jgi:hypothetical protein